MENLHHLEQPCYVIQGTKLAISHQADNPKDIIGYIPPLLPEFLGDAATIFTFGLIDFK